MKAHVRRQMLRALREYHAFTTTDLLHEVAELHRDLDVIEQGGFGRLAHRGVRAVIVAQLQAIDSEFQRRNRLSEMVTAS
jgi:hypothetical protein